jgi:hypothetical protein
VEVEWNANIRVECEYECDMIICPCRSEETRPTSTGRQSIPFSCSQVE